MYTSTVHVQFTLYMYSVHLNQITCTSGYDITHVHSISKYTCTFTMYKKCTCTCKHEVTNLRSTSLYQFWLTSTIHVQWNHDYPDQKLVKLLNI